MTLFDHILQKEAEKFEIILRNRSHKIFEFQVGNFYAPLIDAFLRHTKILTLGSNHLADKM